MHNLNRHTQFQKQKWHVEPKWPIQGVFPLNHFKLHRPGKCYRPPFSDLILGCRVVALCRQPLRQLEDETMGQFLRGNLLPSPAKAPVTTVQSRRWTGPSEKAWFAQVWTRCRDNGTVGQTLYMKSSEKTLAAAPQRAPPRIWKEDCSPSRCAQKPENPWTQLLKTGSS